MNNSLSIVVFALNKEHELRQSYQRVKNILVQRKVEHEFTIVNDGSVDRTWEVANKIAENDPVVKIINHQFSRGTGFSYREALQQTNKDFFMWMNGYCVVSDEDLNTLFDVIGHTDLTLIHIKNPSIRSIGRRVMSRFFTILMNTITGLGHRYYNGMLFCRTNSLKSIKIRSNGYTFQAEAISKLQLQHNCSSKSIGLTLEARNGKSNAVKVQNFINVAKFFIFLVYDLFIDRKKISKI
mgnify:CR=1|jgi:glycosyltransferase involved in cell wall biosynthesis